MMLLFAVLGSVGAWAQSEVVSIGNTGKSNGYLPIDQYSKYSLTQQIYTKDEINHAAGKITSIAFYGYDYGMERTCDVYLTLTTKNAFESDTDWVKVAPEDKVFSGHITVNNGLWTIIDFDTPYEYDGESNILVTIDDNSNVANSSTVYWGVFDASGNQAMYYSKRYSTPVNLDPTQDIDELGVYYARKNCIQLCFETNPKPYKVEAVEVGDESAQIQCSLRGDAKAWNVRYRKVAADGEEEQRWTQENDLTTRSFTIEDLTAFTKYEVQVQAVYGEGVLSVWTSSIPFTTNCCPVEEQAEIRYVLNGSNRVWKNFAVQILDITKEENPVEVAYLNPPGDDVYEGYLTLCCNHKYKVNWIYDENNPDFNQYYSVALYYDNADLIYRMATGDAPEEDAELTTFVVDCGDYCTQMPKNLSIDDISYNNVTISFTSTTAGGKIAYSTEADFNPATATNTQSVNFVPDGDSGSSNSYSYKLTGLEPVTDYYVAVQSLCSAQLLDDGGKSRWTKPVKVKTGPEEAPVDNITVVNDGSSKSKVSWTPKGRETMHNVYIRQQTGTGTPVDASQIQMFNLIKEDGATYENWGGGQYASRATSGETSKWFVVTGVPANAVVKTTTDEADTKTKMTNTKGVTTEVFSSGAEKQENDGSNVEALKDEIKTKITNLKKVRDDGKKLSKKQWKEKYRLYKKAQLAWDDAEEGSAEEKALEEQMKSLKRELGLDKRNVKKAVKRGTNAGFKAYKRLKKSKKTRAADTEEYFVWFNHEDGVGYFSISELEIVTEENWGDWTSYTDVTGNSYDFENLTPGTTYEVMIEPVYDDGTTGPEDVFLFTTFGTEADPIEGEFSVSADKKVQFAKGNLQYSGDSEGYEAEWSMAKQQYEILGDANIETSGSSSYPADSRDLFCWSTAKNYCGVYGYYYDDDPDAYFKGDFVDWGTDAKLASALGSGWSTLSKNEWNYLLNERKDAEKLKMLATVANVKGLVLLPDEWKAPDGVLIDKEMTAEQWATVEETGVVFLPVAGQMTATYDNSSWTTTTNFTEVGTYWTSTPAGDKPDQKADILTITAEGATLDADLLRRTYTAVRLVKVAAAATPGDVDGDGDIDEADLMAVIDYIIGKIPTKPTNADMDGSGDVDIVDLTLMIKKIK